MKDEHNRGCDWYNDKPDQCGDFDTSTFIARSMCCACSEKPPCDCDPTKTKECCCPNPTTDICAVTACHTDDYYGEDYFENNCKTCWDVDTEWFNVAEYTYEEFDGKRVTLTGHPYYPDGRTFTDSNDNPCSWYNAQPWACGWYDTDEFWADEFCCACGSTPQDRHGEGGCYCDPMDDDCCCYIQLPGGPFNDDADKYYHNFANSLGTVKSQGCFHYPDFLDPAFDNPLISALGIGVGAVAPGGISGLLSGF